MDRVYQHTRNAILMGEYPPGFPLRVQELATLNGVSTIPVREALRRLEAARLIESVANKGARVAQLSFPDLADAYRIRTILEVEAVRLAFPRLAPEDLTTARELKEEMTRLFEEDRIEDAHEAHRKLHFLIYEKTDSTWLLHIIQALWDHTERYRRLATQWALGSDDLGKQHDDVIDALSDRDLERAIAAVRQHFEYPTRMIEERVNRENLRRVAST